MGNENKPKILSKMQISILEQTEDKRMIPPYKIRYGGAFSTTLNKALLKGHDRVSDYIFESIKKDKENALSNV